MKLEEKTVNGILSVIDGLIEDGKRFAGMDSVHTDYKVFIDQEGGQVAIMFLDGPDKDSWSGHLYELKNGMLDIVEYGAFDFVNISRWPCFNYKELNVEAMLLAFKNGIKVGNRYRIDHLCSENDTEVLDIDFETGEVTLKDCLYGYKGRHDGEPWKNPIKFISEQITREQWYRWILIDKERNDIK